MFPDIFLNDAFSVIAMTEAINKIPFVPGRIGRMGLFAERRITATKITIEEKSGTLSLLSPTPRGGPGQTFDKGKRNIRALVVPHLQVDAAIVADEVQGVREFGTTDQLATVQGVVNDKMAEQVPYFDATLEYQRVGAVKGIITYADGSSVNLFTEFGVAQEAEIDFDLDNANPAAGAVYKKCASVVRLVAGNLGGMPHTGIHSLCGDAFWDDLITHPEVADTFKYQEGIRLRDRQPWQTVDYGGITFENYRGAVGATAFIDTDKAHFFPVGVPNLFSTHFGPADYMETVNTPGLPRYAKAIPMRNDKGMDIEMQSNPLSLCTMPKVLIKAKRT
ncbi:MAG: major capsid protein [Bauldia sp.]|nr:MAG: major capsid protein [Bauldia sp.]